MTEADQGIVSIEAEADIAAARRIVREVATKIGFGVTETVRIVTAASELGRNVHKYAGKGIMHWRWLHNSSGVNGIELCFEDQGPGIANLDDALKEGHSTGGGLGMGLPGAKRLMDQMEIRSERGAGTTVTITKWRRN
jgi:serine/threonine-protein kinase RsbT